MHDRIRNEKGDEAGQTRNLAEERRRQNGEQGVARGELYRVKGEQPEEQDRVDEDRRGEENGDGRNGRRVRNGFVGVEDDVGVEGDEVDGLAYPEETREEVEEEDGTFS